MSLVQAIIFINSSEKSSEIFCGAKVTLIKQAFTPPDFDRKGLLDAVLGQLKINRHGVHGPSHWARVLYHGLAIGAEVGANLLVVELFSFLHDSQRWNEYEDKQHGERAADFAASMNHRFFELSGSDLDVLMQAIRSHSDGGIETCPTMQTCWDADRLDLGRVGIKPNAKYLSVTARNYIESAYEWSII